MKSVRAMALFSLGIFSFLGCASEGADPVDPPPTFEKSRGRTDDAAAEIPTLPSDVDAGAGSADGGPPSGDGGGGFSFKPSPSGCITDVSPGNHTYTCEGLAVDVAIPDMSAKCPAMGCGLVLELHGDTGTGPLIDAHTLLRTKGPAKGYIVVAPTGPAVGALGSPPVTYPGSTWNVGTDAKLVAITQAFANVFRPDPKRVHVTGFSRGGFATWRLACDHSDLFASVAVGGAGNGASPLGSIFGSEATCFEGTHYPARNIDMLMLVGKTDAQYNKMVSLRTNALTRYALSTQETTTVGTPTTSVTHKRATAAGKGVIEWYEHTYEVDPTNADPLGKVAKGHCIPGSQVLLSEKSYNVACKAPNAIDWGGEILAFFDAHPKP